MATGADKLWAYPRFLHPLVQKFIPEVSSSAFKDLLHFSMLNLRFKIDQKCAKIPRRWCKVSYLGKLTIES